MKQTKEYLKEMNISEQNPTVQAILKLVEKAPNYEYFFIKSHFGRERVTLESIKNTFHLMKDKNIKVSKSVDQYVKFIIVRPFKTNTNLGDHGISNTHGLGEIITRQYYKSLPDYHQKNVEMRTDFEAFSDEVRDGHTKLIANKVIQEFPASAKAVIDSLNEKEKKELYYNLSTLYSVNFVYLIVNEFNLNGKIYKKSSKISQNEYLALPNEVKNKNIIPHVEAPYISFIKKSARYKTKEALFNDINVALYSMHGSDEYKTFIELIENTENAFLEGVNAKKGIIVASALNAHSYSKIGGNKTNHCISASYGTSAPATFNSTVAFGYKQYLIINTELEPADVKRIIGLTIDDNGNITRAHAKNDNDVKDVIHQLLISWGVRQYIKPMSGEEILESLYAGIENESIFTDQSRCNMVIKHIDKLDPKRYQKKKFLNFIRFTHKPNEMRKIVRDSLDMNSSEKFLENYDYLVHTVLKFINDDEQATNIIRSFVIEYNENIGITKEDTLSLLYNKSNFVQPTTLIEIITEDKFYNYCMSYNEQEIAKLLEAVPQYYINYLRFRKTVTEVEAQLILKALYTYETRKDIRQPILAKFQTKGFFVKITKKDLEAFAERVASDIIINKGIEFNETTIRAFNNIRNHLINLGFEVGNKNIEKIDISTLLKSEIDVLNKKRFSIDL